MGADVQTQESARVVHSTRSTTQLHDTAVNFLPISSVFHSPLLRPRTARARDRHVASWVCLSWIVYCTLEICQARHRPAFTEHNRHDVKSPAQQPSDGALEAHMFYKRRNQSKQPHPPTPPTPFPAWRLSRMYEACIRSSSFPPHNLTSSGTPELATTTTSGLWAAPPLRRCSMTLRTRLACSYPSSWRRLRGAGLTSSEP